MDGMFSQDTIAASDFLAHAVTFTLALTVFLGLKGRRHWLNPFFVSVLFLQWVIALVSKALPAKIFVTLLLLSLVTVEAALRRRWRSKAADGR